MAEQVPDLVLKHRVDVGLDRGWARPKARLSIYRIQRYSCRTKVRNRPRRATDAASALTQEVRIGSSLRPRTPDFNVDAHTVLRLRTCVRKMPVGTSSPNHTTLKLGGRGEAIVGQSCRTERKCGCELSSDNSRLQGLPALWYLIRSGG